MANPGLPDIDALASMGGALKNYANVADVTTDLDAEFDNRSRMQVAMMSHTAIRAWARVTLAATTGAMILVAHDAVWGNTAPVAPTPARTSSGLFTLTWPATVNDELARVHTVNFRCAFANSRDGTNGYILRAAPTAANILSLTARTDANVLSDMAVPKAHGGWQTTPAAHPRIAESWTRDSARHVLHVGGLR